MIKKFKGKEGVSEIIGTVLMLGIAVIIFSSLLIYVLSMETETSSPDVHLVGHMDKWQNAIVEHRGGESFTLKDIQVVFTKELKRVSNLGVVTIHLAKCSMIQTKIRGGK